MKRIILTLLLIAFCFVSAAAQQWVEVVYLKNGGVIRGTVIEQIPNETIKIQTADGSVFVYKIDEVEKIAKEQQQNQPKYHYEPSVQRSQRTSYEQTEPYQGRKKEHKVSVNIGLGIAPSAIWGDLLTSEETIYEMFQEYASDVTTKRRLGSLLHAGIVYERFFKPGSGWFWDAGAYYEQSRLGVDYYIESVKGFGGTAIYNYAAVTGGFGMQTSPNTEGLHFYWKAGVGVGLFSPATFVVRGYGPAAGIQRIVSDDQWSGIHMLPYTEIGFGGDSFFKIGIRYTPYIGDVGLWSHGISLAVTCPIF